METSELYLGRVSFRYALLAVSVPSKYSWNQGCKLRHRFDPDGSLCGYHYCAGCGKLPKEERESASGKPWTFLFPRGTIKKGSCFWRTALRIEILEPLSSLSKGAAWMEVFIICEKTVFLEKKVYKILRKCYISFN